MIQEIDKKIGDGIKGKVVDIAAPQKVKIYHYHPETGELGRDSYAEVDPVGNNPMIPANSTDLKPPPRMEGHALCFDGAWKHIKDLRGVLVYNKINGEGQKINSLLFKIENHDHFTFDEPKGGQVWSFSRNKWSYPYTGLSYWFQPIIRLWKSIVYTSDMYDVFQRQEEFKNLQRIKAEENKT